MVKLAERYAHAVGSHNLKSDSLHSDTDVLRAIALSSPYGGLLLRAKYQNDPSAYRKLRDHWTWVVSTKALRRDWPDHIPIDKIARISLRVWAFDNCPACTGRKQQTIFNTPSLSDKNCPLCNGSGTQELRCDPSLRDYVLDMIEELHAATRTALARASRKMGPDVTPDMLIEMLRNWQKTP